MSGEGLPLTEDNGGRRGVHGLLRYRFAGAEFDEAKMQLSVGGQPVGLEPRPMRLLLELLRHAGEVVTRTELIETVWDGRETVDNVVANAVGKLRRALGDEAGLRIVNVPRIGYRLSGAVERQAISVPHHVGALSLSPGELVPGRPSYVLDRALGGDGRQHVWLAHQPRAGQQRVFKFATDADGLRALKREFTLHRVLHHELGPRADMVRLQDANFSESPYFIEMEYGGIDLASWAQEPSPAAMTGPDARAFPSSAPNQLAALSQDERLALLMGVVQAVAAAHSVGVLHKDIKPANVLIRPVTHPLEERPPSSHLGTTGSAPRWQVSISDFGSGRALDISRLRDLGVTALGMTVSQLLDVDSLRGTPLYLAPEALSGGVATAQSDVYALGVMLYQMLVGDLRRPLATGWQTEISEELLRRDIEAATQGDPRRRLQTAAELLSRLSSLEARRRELAEETLRMEEQQRLIDDDRRRRARRPWLATMMFSLVLGAATSTVLGLQARASLKQAEQSARKSEQMLQFLGDDLLSGIAVERMGPGGTVSMREVLDQSARQAASRFKDQPLIESELRQRLALTYNRIYQLDAALREAQKALTLVQDAPDQGAAKAHLPQAHLHVAYIHLGMRKLPLAEEQLALANAAWRDLPAGNAAAPHEVNDALGRRFVETRFRIAGLKGQLSEALALGEQLVSMTESGAPHDLPARWAAQMRLGEIEFFTGNLEKAEARFLAMRSAPFNGNAIGPVQQARATVQWARTRVSRGRVEGLDEPLEQSMKVLKEFAGPGDNFVLMAMETAARAHARKGEFAQAEARYRESLEALVATKGAASAEAHVSRAMVGVMLLEQGRPGEGLRLIEPARDWFAALPGGAGNHVVQALDFERARAMNLLGKPGVALALLEPLDAQRIQQASPEADWPHRLKAEHARALLLQGDKSRGVPLLGEAISGMELTRTPEWVLQRYRRLSASAKAD